MDQSVAFKGLAKYIYRYTKITIAWTNIHLNDKQWDFNSCNKNNMQNLKAPHLNTTNSAKPSNYPATCSHPFPPADIVE